MIRNLLALLILAFSGHALAGGPSQECEYLKRSHNDPDRSINIVFVPSGFGADTEGFAEKMRSLWVDISEFEPFSEQVKTMNVTIAKVAGSEEGFCSFKNANKRVLECDFAQPARVAKKCYEGENRYIITIHNTNEHGGNGARYGASATLAKDSAAIIAHELGHSIFELADEYQEDGSTRGKNCSKKSTCDEWKDLIEAGLATCEEGCEGNTLYTSPQTLMGSLKEKSFGHVNQRLVCCRFNKLTGNYPPFCSQYRTIGKGLDSFCR